MKTAFPLFSSHLDLAHDYWQRLLKPNNIAVDATCGNGHDALRLAKLLPAGTLYCIDNQKVALDNTKALLAETQTHVLYSEGCHSQFPDEISPHSVKLIVYNLGYLPGGDKQHTTQTHSTLTSLQNALKLVCEGGCISITCYPGHAEGAREEVAILDWVKTLSPKEWSCCHHRWMNRMASPSLLLIQRV